MSLNTIKIMRSRPKPAWITKLKARNRSIPQKVVAELLNLSGIEQAQAFVESAGLKTLPHYRSDCETIYLIPIDHPGHLKGLDSTNLEYYAPKIILPKSLKFKNFPVATAWLEFVVPRISATSKEEKIFQEYQARLVALSNRLKASPCFWLSGHINENLIGFRFLFSSGPNNLFDIMQNVQRKRKALQECTDHKKQLELLDEINSLIFAKVIGLPKDHPQYGSKTGYPLFGENGFGDSMLVDLR